MAGSGDTSHLVAPVCTAGVCWRHHHLLTCVATVPLDRTEGPLNQRLGKYTLTAPPVLTCSHSSLCPAIVMPIPPAFLVVTQSVVGALHSTERDATSHRITLRRSIIRCIAWYRGPDGNGWNSPCHCPSIPRPSSLVDRRQGRPTLPSPVTHSPIVPLRPLPRPVEDPRAQHTHRWARWTARRNWNVGGWCS